MKKSDPISDPIQRTSNSMTDNVFQRCGRALMFIKKMALKLSPFPTIDIKKLEESTAESDGYIEKVKAEYLTMKNFVELAMTMIHDSGVYLWHKDLSGRYKFASRAMVSRLLLPQTAANIRTLITAAALSFKPCPSPMSTRYMPKSPCRSSKRDWWKEHRSGCNPSARWCTIGKAI